MDKAEINKLTKNLPIVKKDITEAYLEATNNLRNVISVILDRELSTEEKSKVRIYSYGLATNIVEDRYMRRFGLNEMSKADARKLITDMLTEDSN
mgnify:CR=1 FL=1